MTGTAHDNDWDRQQPTLGRKVLLAVLAVCGLFVLYLIGAAIIPRWWSQRVADVVDGRMTVGALFGLFIGLVFTVAPLVAAWIIIRLRSERRTWKGWIGWAGVVALTAAPNLMTLGIVTGGNNAAHAGDRTLDVDGPGFRVFSLVGVILGVVAVAAVWYLARSRRRQHRKATEYRDELRSRDEQRTRDEKK